MLCPDRFIQFWLPLILLLFVPIGGWAVLYAILGDATIAFGIAAISVLLAILTTTRP